MRYSTRQSKTQQLLVHRARLLRANPSWPEQVLWKAIRSGQLGVPFRRQVPLGCYVGDFVAPRAKLIVEVDGSSHRVKQVADARRDRKLARLGCPSPIAASLVRCAPAAMGGTGTTPR